MRMARKCIDLRRINEHCVNDKMMEAVKNLGFEADETEISLVKMSLRYRRTRKRATIRETSKQFDYKKACNTPFYAFYKPVGKSKAAIYRIDTGEVRIVSTAAISNKNEVKGTFTLNGVTYGPKDTINGFRRFGVYNN